MRGSLTRLANSEGEVGAFARDALVHYYTSRTPLTLNINGEVSAERAAAGSGSGTQPPAAAPQQPSELPPVEFTGPGDTIGDNTSSTTTIAVGGSLTSSVNIGGDVDYIKVSLVAGQTYTFSLGYGTMDDDYVELRNSAGTLIAEDDDGGIVRDSFLKYTATTTGDHWIVARGFDAGNTGSYTLRVNAIQTGSSSPTAFIDNGKPKFSWDEAGIHITRSGASWATDFNTATVVTYAYRSTQPASMPDDTGGFSRFSFAQIAATEASLAAWASVANIVFQRVDSGDGYSNSAVILFANYSSGAEGAAAFAFLPSNGDRSVGGVEGDVWVNISQAGNQDLTIGNQGRHTLMHEIGHAIGLRHPGDYNAGEGEDIQYPTHAEYYNDSRAFTVMSYFGSIVSGTGNLPALASLPQIHDIAAAQRLYGANTGTRTGDTTYGFNSNTGIPEYTLTSGAQGAVFSIWDGGGIDTIDMSGYAVAMTIDLRQEAMSSVGGSTFNVSIARGAVIENAIGGPQQDTIIGNDAANVLTGNGGADTLTGGLGADILDGSLGADTMFGGLGDDLYMVDNAGDAVNEASGEGRDTVYTTISYTLGANVEDLATATSNAVNLYGNALANLIVGNSAVNTLDGAGGADTLVGGAGNDLYLVDNIADVIIEGPAEGTADIVYASLSFYQMGDNVEQFSATTTSGAYAVGNSINNLMVGNTGADTLDGGAGVDTLIGGAGNDLYFVDNISDVIIEGAGQGAADIVYTSLSFYQMGDNVEQLSVTTAGGTYAVGNSVNNLIVGNGGADTLDGGAGVDTLIGGAGNDLYFVDNVADVIIEGASEGTADIVYSALAFYALGDNVEQLSITTSAGAYGAGNSINNLIVGNSGADGLEGRLGSDVLVGNGGADAFIYNTPAEGGDAIVDFVSGSDWLQIDASGFGGGLVAGGGVTLISGANPSAGAGSAFLYDTDDGRLYWDADGAGGQNPVFIAIFSNNPTLTASDFILGP